MEGRAFPGGEGGVLDQYLVYRWAAGGLRPWPCLGQKNSCLGHWSFTVFAVVFQALIYTDYSLIQFLKQGPAYKKEEPDPNKGSDQQ